jgi:hypothetical protein
MCCNARLDGSGKRKLHLVTVPTELSRNSKIVTSIREAERQSVCCQEIKSCKIICISLIHDTTRCGAFPSILNFAFIGYRIDVHFCCTVMNLEAKHSHDVGM